jgi:hypothetical protein
VVIVHAERGGCAYTGHSFILLVAWILGGLVVSSLCNFSRLSHSTLRSQHIVAVCGDKAFFCGFTG